MHRGPMFPFPFNALRIEFQVKRRGGAPYVMTCVSVHVPGRKEWTRYGAVGTVRIILATNIPQ